MFKRVLIYLLALAIGFPPGSYPTAMAEAPQKSNSQTPSAAPVNLEKIKHHEKLVNEISEASMQLTSMLMQLRFPGSKPLSFQKAPTLSNLSDIKQTMSQWKALLQEDWEDLLLNTARFDDDGLKQMVAKAESLSLEVILYYQAQYLYLATLSFLATPSPEQIEQLIDDSKIQIPLENVMNYQFFTQVFRKLIQAVSDVIDAGPAKSLIVKIDQCTGHMNCLNFSMSTAKAYRALESANQHKDSNEAFLHFTRLIILENYINSYAKLDYYLNPGQNTLQLPEVLKEQHPSLMYLYEETKNNTEDDPNFRFSEWLGTTKGNAKLVEVFNELNEDPLANLANDTFIKKYTALLKGKAKTSPVLAAGRLDEIYKTTKGDYIAQNVQNFATITDTLDKQKKFKEDVWLDVFLIIKNIYLQSELLSDPQLDDSDKVQIHTLIKSELSAIKKRVDASKYKQKIKALYQSFRDSLKNEMHENVVRGIYETSQQLNMVYGTDYELLILAMQQSRPFKDLRVTDFTIKTLNIIADSFKKEGLVQGPKINELHIRFAKSYYEHLHALLKAWSLIKKDQKLDMSFNDLLKAVDQVKKMEPGYYEDLSVYKVEKDLHDWLKIGELFEVHNGHEMVSDNLANALSKEEAEEKIFSLDADFVKTYQELLEDKLSSQFPLLSTKSSTTKIMKGMGSDRKEYEIPVTMPQQALWKHLKGKTFEEAKPMIVAQLATTRSYIQKQMKNLADEVNAKTSFFTRMKTEMGFSRFDELNGQIPETTALHLAYSSVLSNELKDYGMASRLKQFRQQKAGMSNFQMALDRVIDYTAIYYIAMIGVQLASVASFARVPIVKKGLSFFSRASSTMTRDGLGGVVAKWRGQPITLFGSPMSYVDIGFWGGLAISSIGYNFGNAVDGLNTDMPFLEDTYTNQVSCSDKFEYSEFANHGCQIADKSIIEGQRQTYNSAMNRALITAAVIPAILVGLPKVLQYAQKVHTRIRSQNSSKNHDALERLLQDVGYGQGIRSFNTNDIRHLTHNVLKEFYQKNPAVTGSARRNLTERIFVLTRYLQLKTMVKTENTFWASVDSALATHWKRLGVTPESKDWIRRFDPQLINGLSENLRIHFANGRVSVKQYEGLTQDIQTISSALQPAWRLLKDAGMGKAGNYAQLVRHAIDTRLGLGKSLPIVEAAEIQTVRNFNALYVRSETNAQNQIALIRLTPYEMSAEAKVIAEEVKKQHVKKLIIRKMKLYKGFGW